MIAKRSNAQVAEDLRESAKYIEDHGWSRGKLFQDDGSVCALGALSKSLGAQEFGQAGHTLYTYLIAHDLLGDLYSIPAWNDYGVLSGVEVIQTFQKAAAWIEEQA